MRKERIPVGGTASYTFSGLTASSVYNIFTEVGTIVNGIAKLSNFAASDTCKTTVTTLPPADCNPPTGLTVLPALA